MAKKKKTNSCLIGCGVGCLILLILGIAMFAGGAVWMRGLVSGFEDAAETRDALEAEFGEPGDFTPATDGSIATVSAVAVDGNHPVCNPVCCSLIPSVALSGVVGRQTPSMIVAVPIPAPMHRVTSALPRPRRSISSRAVPNTMAPVAPSG